MKCKYCSKNGQHYFLGDRFVCEDHWLLIMNCTKIPNHIPDEQSIIYLGNYYDKKIR